MQSPRRSASSLLAPIFINGGLDAIRNPESKVKAAEAVTRPLSLAFDFVPDDPVVLVRANGAVQVAAGTLFCPRKAAPPGGSRPGWITRADHLRGSRFLERGR
jgi:hypothetical protein